MYMVHQYMIVGAWRTVNADKYQQKHFFDLWCEIVSPPGVDTLHLTPYIYQKLIQHTKTHIISPKGQKTFAPFSMEANVHKNLNIGEVSMALSFCECVTDCGCKSF